MVNKIEVNEILNSLLSTLEEGKFFKILTSAISKEIGCDNSFSILIQDGKISKLIGRPQSPQNFEDRSSMHVFKTKNPYFCNNINRDPLFIESNREGFESELIVPLAHEGDIFATLHFQNEIGKSKFSIESVDQVNKILSILKTPISNMKLYLDSKNLNNTLLKKVDELIKAKSKKIEPNDFQKIKEPAFSFRSNVMGDFLNLVDKLSKMDNHIMLQGEAATGKELLAKRIHCRSERKENSFFSFNCSTTLEKNLEKEIFGYEELDATGKLQIYAGILEKANNGSLLLKDIHLLSTEFQNRIIEFIKENKAYRVGGIERFPSNVRIICTINTPTEELVSKGIFKKEFPYFFNLIKVPSLKERQDDIELLATKFLNGARNTEEHKTLSPCLVKALKEYSWPGNIRELKNVMEEAYLMADGLVVERIHLPQSIIDNKSSSDKDKVPTISYLGITLGDLEKKHIVDTLEYTQGNKTKTAKILGITVKTLYNKLHSYGMITAKV
jgi:Nif-specific regulatory protein